MSLLQFRPSSDAPHYSPQRDVAHFLPALLNDVAARLVDDPMDWVAPLRQASPFTDQDLVHCARVLAQVYANILEDPAQSFDGAMQVEGFDQVAAGARLAWLSQLGYYFLLSIWMGVRDISRPQSEPPPSIREFVDSITRAAEHTGPENKTCSNWIQRAWKRCVQYTQRTRSQKTT